MATYRFSWKLIGSDAFEQDYVGFASQQEAYEAWFYFWRVEPCECDYCRIEELEDETS